MNKTILAAIALVSVVATAAPRRDLVLVRDADWSIAARLAHHGLVINRAREEGLEVEATAEQQALVNGLGYRTDVLEQDIQALYSRNAGTLSTDAWYMPYTHYRDTMITIALNNSGFIKLETLGYSASNRPLLAMKFSDNPQVEEYEPQVHFEGNIHGDEAITFGIYCELVKYLASNYAYDTLVTRLIDEREIWVAPLVNPDGYEAHSRYNANSVDLNRNWGHNWGNSSRCGNSPMSEPETRAFMAHCMRHPFVLNASYHSGTKYLAYPWSYTRYCTIPDKPHVHFLSQRYNAHTSYPYGQGAVGMYPLNGGAKDLEYAWGSLTWSIEIHNTKWPNASEIVPTWNLNRPAMLELFHHAGKGIHGTVTDATTDEPVHAQVWVGPGDFPGYTDTTLGDYHRFYLPGTYSITFRAPGYRDTTVTNVVVPTTGDSSVTVDVQMTPDLAEPLFGFRVIYSLYVTTSSNRTYPVWALGPHDGRAYQLDNNKYICLDMNRAVHDQTGVDLTVYRSSGSGSATVKGSNDWTGPWTTLGTASSPETSFDLSSSGLDSVRFIRLDASSQFFFDAVEGVNYTGVNERPGTPVRTMLTLSTGPNPATGNHVSFSVNRAPSPGSKLTVTDATGRKVASLLFSTSDLDWDLRDQSDRQVPNGVYFARVTPNGSEPVRVILAR